MWTLADTLDRMERHLDRALVPPPARARLRRAANGIPAALTRRVYLESWLRPEAGRVDLIVKIDAEGRDLLADRSWAALDVRLGGRPSWQALAAFARAWARPGGPLDRGIKSLWLEFDLDPSDGSISGPPEPRVFVDFQEPARRQASVAARMSLAVEAVRSLGADDIANRVAEPLEACIESLPAGATVPYLGVSPGRDATALRVCVHGLGGRMADYLVAVGWPGDVNDLAARLPPPRVGTGDGPGTVASVLHLDLCPDVAPRLGIEYPFERDGQPRGRLVESSFLDDLVARGWCPPARREALLRWPGRSVELLAHEVWHSRVTRHLNHVKVTYATGGPPAVKAYLCFFFELFPYGTLLGTRPWLPDASR